MILLNHPVLFSLFSFFVLYFSARAGAEFRNQRPLSKDDREDFALVQAATLTLLGLIIGFTFSMAIGRYDQRRNYEEAEANSIGTEFVRTGLLSLPEAAQTRARLVHYLDLRIGFYRTRDAAELRRINAATAQLQLQLWSGVQTAALAQPTPVAALTAAGMNDVLNSQGYTQAAWWNRIPAAAWSLMFAIAICCNVLVGYGGSSHKVNSLILTILPFFVSVAFLLIADIDSPRGGLIHVPPQNLIDLAQSLPR